MDHQAIEMPGEEVGDEERAWPLFDHRRDRSLARIKGVAVRPGDAGHFLFGEHRVERAARAAIAIKDEDFIIPRAIGSDLAPIASGMRSGRLCNCAGRHETSKSPSGPRDSATISRASAPQAITSDLRGDATRC